MEYPNAIETYWKEPLGQLRMSSFPATRRALPVHTNDWSSSWRVEWIGSTQESVYGVLSIPWSPGPQPTLLIIPPYGSADRVASYEMRQQYITLNLRHRGMRLTRSLTRAEFPGFLTEGIESIATYGMAKVLEDCLIGADFLIRIPERDDCPLIIRGHEFALLAAALAPKATHVVSHLSLWHRIYEILPMTKAYPLEEVNDLMRLHPDQAPQIRDILNYLEPMNMVHLVQAETLLITGGDKDLRTPAMGAEIFSALGAPAEARGLYESKHSSSLDEQHILEWMAGRCGLKGPVLPDHWKG